jgi:uncharacterized radical SAM superfamily protein
MNEELLERCFSQPFEELQPLFDEAFRISRSNFSNLIHFYVPGMVHFDTPFFKSTGSHGFPSISVTGKGCQLNCEHCHKKLLDTMIPAATPQGLYDVCVEIKEKGGKGCLISGGALKDGSVPLMDFVPIIKRIKQNLGLKVVVHTGLIYPALAKALAEANIDAAMLDVIGSKDTIKEVYHLNCDTDSFDRSLSLLEQQNIPTVPHIVVGIHFGKLKGEKEALAIILKHHPAAVVVVALMPLSGAPMEHVAPPSPQEIARVALAARLLMPTTPLLLGCARPRGEHKIETDILGIKAGVNGIAYPSEEVCDFAKSLGLEFKFAQQCCSLLWQDINSTRAR